MSSTSSSYPQNGDRVGDIVSGLIGIVTAESVFLNGCRRLCVSPPVGADGSPRSDCWFDEQQLEVLKKAVVSTRPAQLHNVTTTGGDRPDCPRPVSA